MKSLAEVADRWSIETLLDANIALDIWDTIHAAKPAPLPKR